MTSNDIIHAARMASFPGILIGFVLGCLINSITTPLHRQLLTIPALNSVRDKVSSRGFPPVCFDSYANWPLSKARNIADTALTQPMPGLSHLTLSGRTHTGMRSVKCGTKSSLQEVAPQSTNTTAKKRSLFYRASAVR